MRIAYLFTTFPVLSETFLQREIRAMRELPVQIDIYSLHKGKKEFEGLPVHCFRKWELIQLLWLLPFRFIQYPRILFKIFVCLCKQKMPSWINCGETFLGIAFAVIYARKFRKDPPDLYHAVWATMPASAAMLLREFTGIPYSMGAHAYDVFRYGGDWLLPQKLTTARLIHTTTEATKKALLERNAREDKITLIRRGLHFFPEVKPTRPHEGPLRILSVGRLVEKKGYSLQLKIYHALEEAGIPFEARIVGCGPLSKQLKERKKKLGIKKRVLMLGKLDYSGVVEQYEWADAFIFTGIIAENGDRDGLPNVIPEAMAIGVPVITSPVAGTTEAITHEKTGLIVRPKAIPEWIEALQRIRDDQQLVRTIKTHARQWVEDAFDARKNAALLAEKLRASAAEHPTIRSPWIGRQASQPQPQAVAPNASSQNGNLSQTNAD